MKKLIARLLINGVAFYFTARYIPGISYSGGTAGLAVITLWFSILNLFLKPLINLLAFPLKILTFGLFSLVVNGGLLWLTAYLLENFTLDSAWFPGLEIGPLLIAPGYWPQWAVAIVGALSISLISGFLTWLIE